MQPDEKDAYLGRRQWKCESELFRRDGEGLLIAVYFMTSSVRSILKSDATMSMMHMALLNKHRLIRHTASDWNLI
jgi:hypothetical protein